MSKKNLSKLVKKKVTGKDGKLHTVWVRMSDAKEQPEKKKEFKDYDEAKDYMKSSAEKSGVKHNLFVDKRGDHKTVLVTTEENPGETWKLQTSFTPEEKDDPKMSKREKLEAYQKREDDEYDKEEKKDKLESQLDSHKRELKSIEGQEGRKGAWKDKNKLVQKLEKEITKLKTNK